MSAPIETKEETKLVCPRCSSPLEAADVPSLALVGCVRCGGAWVDARGCGALARDARPEVATRARELAEGARVDASPEEAIACPVCTKPMERHTLPVSGLTLDRCLEHGTWFDRGELRTVAFLAEDERGVALPFERPEDTRTGWGAVVLTATGVLDLVFALGSLLPS